MLFFFDILLAVTYLHRNNIIHRDIKLQNCLIRSNKNANGKGGYIALLSDFGLSIRADPNQ